MEQPAYHIALKEAAQILDHSDAELDRLMTPDRIILSAKVSRVQDLIDVYRELGTRSDLALHLGACTGCRALGRRCGRIRRREQDDK